MNIARRLVTDAVTLTRPGWLPADSRIEWLDSLGADHRRLLAARRAASDARTTLVDGYEQETERRRVAITLGFRTGREPDLAPPTTPEEQQAALRAADEQLAAANDALDSFLTEATATLEQRAPEWLAGLDGQHAEAEELRREAQRLVAEADAAEVRIWRLTEWIKRNGGLHERAAFRNNPGFRFIDWDSMQGISGPTRPPLSATGHPLTQLTDTHHPETFKRDLNRGVLPTPPNNTED